MPLALRMDDVGAASKLHERYAKPLPLPGRLSLLGNALFLKALPPFRAWGPYRELTAFEWTRMIDLLRVRKAVMTVGVTATWVRSDGSLEPFPERFPQQARLLREAAHAGILEIANHGLTHCVLRNAAFRPRAFRGNRTSHREFWSWVDPATHHEHLRRSQEILERWLGMRVTTFVPPGNVFTVTTLEAAREYGIEVVSCATEPRTDRGLTIIGNENVQAFHDRDVVLHGIDWLRMTVDRAHAAGRELRLVRDLAA